MWNLKHDTNLSMKQTDSQTKRTALQAPRGSGRLGQEPRVRRRWQRWADKEAQLCVRHEGPQSQSCGKPDGQDGEEGTCVWN